MKLPTSLLNGALAAVTCLFVLGIQSVNGESAVLAVNVVGRGSVAPSYNNLLLEVGKTYRATARPASGFKFSSWSGSVNGLEVFNTNKTALTFQMQAGLSLTATFVDARKPTLKITQPKRNQRASNELFSVAGTTRDNGPITVVRVRVNETDWQDASTTDGWTNWTAAVSLTPGPNVVLAYAVDAGGNVSRTNKAAVTLLTLFKLTDYFPLPLGAQWTYTGSDSDGNPAMFSQEVTSVNFIITNYFGTARPVPYATNAIQLSRAFLDPISHFPYDTWEEYLMVGEYFGLFGDDDLPDESLRVSSAFTFPEKMAVGPAATVKGNGYMFGKSIGAVTASLQLLEHGAYTVPAGTFDDVLHVRIRLTNGKHTQVNDEWWAKSVGLIKRVKNDSYELISYSMPHM